MDTMEYRRLIERLDGQIDSLKKLAEDKARREAIEQAIKLRDYWIEGLEKRKAEFVKYGATPPPDLDAKIAEIRKERDAQVLLFETKELAGALSVADALLLEALCEEIELTKLDPLAPEERWLLFEVWSIRWRIVASRLLEEAVNGDSRLKRPYALIREAMQAQKEQGWFIEALDKTKKYGDWESRLKTSQERLDRARLERQTESEKEEASEAAIWNLLAAVRNHAQSKNEETDRSLRHHLRQIGRFPHLREEGADIVGAFRADLEAEFGFLWAKDGKQEEDSPAPARKLTNRDIAERLLRRMKSKTLIGACHGPLERICTGFPDHDKGRAKEAMALLGISDVVRIKSSVIGQRVSIKAVMMPRVERFLAGSRMDIKAVDEWCEEAVKK